MLNLPQVFFQIYIYYRPFDFIFKNWLSFSSAHKCLFKIYTRSIELGVGIVRGFLGGFFWLLYLESVFLSVAYLMLANLARLGISVRC